MRSDASKRSILICLGRSRPSGVNRSRPIADLIRNLRYIEKPRKPRKIESRWIWKPPTSGQIKVNVDESFLGSLG